MFGAVLIRQMKFKGVISDLFEEDADERVLREFVSIEFKKV